MDEAPEKGSISAVAGAVGASHDHVGADHTVAGPLTNSEGGYVPPYRRVAVSALTPDTGLLNAGLIEIDVVALVSAGCGIGSRHRDIDRVIQRDRLMDEAAGKGSVSAVAGAVAAAHDHVGADRPVARPLAGGSGYVPADCRVAVPALSAYAGDLSGALIEVHIVRLAGVGAGTGSRQRDIDRSIDRNTDVDDA